MEDVPAGVCGSPLNYVPKLSMEYCFKQEATCESTRQGLDVTGCASHTDKATVFIEKYKIKLELMKGKLLLLCRMNLHCRHVSYSS